MRYVIVLCIGLLAGAIGTSMVMRVMNLRHAYPRAVMTLMQKHLTTTQHMLRSAQCQTTNVQSQLAAIRKISTEVRPAFGDGLETAFKDALHKLQTRLDEGARASLSSCKAMTETVRSVAQSCDACHQVYR